MHIVFQLYDILRFDSTVVISVVISLQTTISFKNETHFLIPLEVVFLEIFRSSTEFFLKWPKNIIINY